MNRIGSHPGAITFRLSVMVIIFLILLLVFLSYLEGTQKSIEQSSIQQTRRIIDSSLAVVFASYAVKGQLNELNQVAGGNPFFYLSSYNLLPANYVGARDEDVLPETASGWYYLNHRKLVVYKAEYLDTDSYFEIVLDYQDNNQSGQFESQFDDFKSLRFSKFTETRS
ncbi:MAG: hypothetical protein AAF353_10490 [Pseudomonadota bacterium]